MKTSTCRVQVVQSSLRVYAGIWFGCVWCVLGAANASLVAGGLECAQKSSASAPARPQSKDCVKFNSRWTLPESSASSSSALHPALNSKIAGRLTLVRFFQCFINNSADGLAVEQRPLFVDCRPRVKSEEKKAVYFINFESKCWGSTSLNVSNEIQMSLCGNSI